MPTSIATRTALITVGAVAFLGMGTASASAADLNEVLDMVGLGDAVTTNVNGPGDDAVSQTTTDTDPTALLDESTMAGLDPTGALPLSSVSDIVSMDDVDGAVGPEPATSPQSGMEGPNMSDSLDTGSAVDGLREVLAPAAQVDPGHVSATPQRTQQANPLGDVSGPVGTVAGQVNGAVDGLGDTVTGNGVTDGGVTDESVTQQNHDELETVVGGAAEGLAGQASALTER